MDPLETVQIKKDTTYAFIKECHSRGHHTYFLPDNGINLSDTLHFHCQRIEPTDNPDAPFIILEDIILSDDTCDVLFIRTDPPVDDLYIMNTWLLEHAKHCLVVNHPQGVRTVNEKIWATQFSDVIPSTLISANKEDLKSFLLKHKKIILKPTNGFGGSSIFVLSSNSPNINVTLEVMTNNENQHIIAQEYLDDAAVGDKRILLLNGEPLGAVLRVHGNDDHRNNFMAGGEAIKSTITDRDKAIINRLKPHLLSLGLFFVGIDIIGDHLIEVNVTSPTCLQEMMILENKNLAAEVIDELESAVKRKTNDTTTRTL